MNCKDIVQGLPIWLKDTNIKYHIKDFLLISGVFENEINALFVNFEFSIHRVFFCLVSNFQRFLYLNSLFSHACKICINMSHDTSLFR